MPTPNKVQKSLLGLWAAAAVGETVCYGRLLLVNNDGSPDLFVFFLLFEMERYFKELFRWGNKAADAVWIGSFLSPT